VRIGGVADASAAHACRDLRGIYNGPAYICGLAPAGLMTRCATSGVTCYGHYGVGNAGLLACNPATPDGFRCFATEDAGLCLFAAQMWGATGGPGWSTKPAGWLASASGMPTSTVCNLGGITCISNLVVTT
jgi:hypothetical protein